MARVRLDTPLARTIEKRLLETLKNSKDWQMPFDKLVVEAKCDRWLELCKHVVSWLATRRLVRFTGYNSVELELSVADTYPRHLAGLLYEAEAEVAYLKRLMKRQRDEKLDWPKNYRPQCNMPFDKD